MHLYSPLHIIIHILLVDNKIFKSISKPTLVACWLPRGALHMTVINNTASSGVQIMDSQNIVRTHSYKNVQHTAYRTAADNYR